MLRIGVLGVGGISSSHIKSWKSLEGAELAAICDIRPKQMERFPDVPHYTSFEEMTANEKLDIIDICLPTFLHVEYSVKALNMGYHVICEKPVSLHPEDVEKVYDAAKKNNVNFMIAHCLRFWPEYERVKEVYDNGEYGKLLSGHVSRLGTRPGWSWEGWFTDEKRSGLVPFDLHIHDLDFLVYCFGKPESFDISRSKRPDQDYLAVKYKYKDFFITGEASWFAARYPFGAKFLFQFERAVLAFEKGVLREYHTDGTVTDFKSEDAEQSDNTGIPTTNAYFREIKYFKECVEKGVFPDIIKPEELKTVLDIITAF